MDDNQVKNNRLAQLKKTTTLLSHSTHEINNALAIIVGQISIAEILEKKGELTTEKTMSIFEKLKSGGNKITNNITTLREFYKVLNDETTDSPVLLSDVAKSATKINEHWFERKNISIETHIDSKIVVTNRKIDIYLVIDFVFEQLGQREGIKEIHFEVQNNEIIIDFKSPQELSEIQKSTYYHKILNDAGCTIQYLPQKIVITINK